MEGFLEEVTDSESVKSVGMRLFRYINMPRTKENLEFLADVQTVHDQFAILMEKVSNEEGVVRYNPKVQNHKGKTFVEEMQSLVEKDYSYVNKVEK
jgi:Mn-containing catalase